MGALFGCMLIYLAILMHGCDVRDAGNVQAKAIKEAAENCRPQKP